MLPSGPAKETREFDAIVIGSGVGGLTCASLLARFYKKRVLLIEKHFKFGGYSHSFQRPGGYSWDVGLHYVGRMGRSDELRLVMDKVTGERVEWQKFPDPFQHAVFPGFTIPFYSDEACHKRTLIANFPQSQAAIERYFRDVRKALRSGMIASIVGRLPTPAGLLLRFLFRRSIRFAMQTTQNYFDKHIVDRKLQAVLDAQWGDYGLPPQQSPFFMHATIVHHYWNGAYRPAGSAQSISSAVVAIIKEHGGEALRAMQASCLLFDQGRVIGVRAHKTNHPEESSDFLKRRNYKQGCETGGGEIDVVVIPVTSTRGPRPWLGGGLNTVDARWLDFKKAVGPAARHTNPAGLHARFRRDRSG